MDIKELSEVELKNFNRLITSIYLWSYKGLSKAEAFSNALEDIQSLLPSKSFANIMEVIDKGEYIVEDKGIRHIGKNGIKYAENILELNKK